MQFLERMQLEYHTNALDKGVYVIGSCGFDSIPADLGILYAQKQFKGRKRHVVVSLRSVLSLHCGRKLPLKDIT